MAPDSRAKPAPSREALKIASDWLSRRDVGLTPEESRQLAAWRNASPDHAAAWAEVQSVWHAFDVTSHPHVAATLLRELGVRRRRRRTRAYGLSAVACAAAIAAVFTFRPTPSPAPTNSAAVAQSIITRPERRVLADGSVIELNNGAEIAVHYSAARREVWLLHGEAHFAVAKNPSRPFIVTAGGVTARAVGTQFEVNLSSHATAVLVTEGRVAVGRLDPNSDTAPTAVTVMLDAGARVSIPTDTATRLLPPPESVSAGDEDRIQAWRGPRLTLSNTALSDAVVALNRENRTQISIQSESLAQMRLSGVFRADNAEGFVRLLEESYGVKVERQGDRVVLVDTRP
jgi:transmembrane sensor